jgi:hypothetical protein
VAKTPTDIKSEEEKNAAAFGNGVPDAGVTGRASKLA